MGRLLVSTPSSGLNAHLVARRGEFTLDIELDIPGGSTAALLGPNGAGKSTTVEILAGLLPLDDGHITLAGRTLDDATTGVFVPPEHRNVGVVFQQYLLFDHLTVEDNVAFGLATSGRSRHEARRSAAPWITALGLVDLAGRRPRQLSGGQAQRVALARALATAPDLLLLDEPLAALDVSVRAELRRTLRAHMADFEGPRLLITHDPTDAMLFADRILILEGGRITQSGTPDEIRRRPTTPYVAALAGTNLLAGANDGGTLRLAGHALALHTADTHTVGSVLVTIHPSAVALHLDQPHGSPRNTWPTVVDLIEPLGDTVRVTLGEPLALAVDITPGAAQTLNLRPGTPVWAAVKATEVAVHPA